MLWRCWLGSRKGIRPVKTEWWGAGVVIYLERGADLHIVQLIPLPLTVSCFSKIQIGFTFLVSAYPGSPRQRAIKRVCVCVCVCIGQSTTGPSLIPQLGVVVMVEGGILLKQSLLVDIRQSDCCIASVIPNLWSPFWLQSCALESVLIFCPTEDVRLSWMGGWSSSTDRLVEVKLWLVCNGCADKVKWTTKQSWNLRENSWGFGSTGSEVDGFHVFSGKFVYMTYKQTSMLWKKKKDNVFGEFMEELSLWDMAEKNNAFCLKSLLSYAESTFVFRQSYPDITPSVLWYCWLGVRKSIWPVKIDWCGVCVVICLEWGAYGYAYAYASADATAISEPHHLFPLLNPDWFYLSRTSLHRSSWKRSC